MKAPIISEFPPSPNGVTGWPWLLETPEIPDTIEDGKTWPLISIVVPSYNQGQFLDYTIRSILLQGYPNLELIIMDGGSSDGSLKIIQKYAPWITHWESGPDGGQYAAINKGFSICHGEIMAWLNSDDLYFPWTLKTVGEIFTSYSCIDWLISSTPAYTNLTGKTISFTNGPNYSLRWFLGNRNTNRWKGFIPQESTFWRRSLWEKVGSKLDTEMNYAGDFELWSRFFQATCPVTTTTPLGIFRYHEQQKTSTMENYYKEIETILIKVPKLAWFPHFLLKRVVYYLNQMNSEKNWFGTKCDKVIYEPHLNRWQYLRSYSL